MPLAVIRPSAARTALPRLPRPPPFVCLSPPLSRGKRGDPHESPATRSPEVRWGHRARVQEMYFLQRTKGNYFTTIIFRRKARGTSKHNQLQSQRPVFPAHSARKKVLFSFFFARFARTHILTTKFRAKSANYNFFLARPAQTWFFNVPPSEKSATMQSLWHTPCKNAII